MSKITVVIEDYYGDGLMAFQSTSDSFVITDYADCTLADIDEDEDGNKVYRIQADYQTNFFRSNEEPK